MFAQELGEEERYFLETTGMCFMCHSGGGGGVPWRPRATVCCRGMLVGA